MRAVEYGREGVIVGKRKLLFRIFRRVWNRYLILL